ncbi:hypothetical protein ACIQMJ_19410 [Actinosynnema sp. NPDC091369]
MRVTWLLLVALFACVACAPDPEFNRALSDDVKAYVEGHDEERLFTEFTDWEWDELLVFHMSDMSSDEVDEIVGEDVAPLWATGGGVFVYRLEGEVVRYEMMEWGGFCSGSYTTSAHVSSKYACWLHDDAYKPFDR